MSKQYHILNGDSLRQQFPEEIQGEIIVARECLVDGNVEGIDLEELFVTRAEFLSQNYGGTIQEYYEKTVPEFQKIQSITKDGDINLWFEDDLFCQVNLWFTINLLAKSQLHYSVFLVRPVSHNQFGFGGLNKSELISIYENRLLLTVNDKLANLWTFYQNNENEKLLKTAKELETSYPFILPAVQAHIDRISTTENLGKPSQTLIQIMKELNTEEFAPVFKEFSKRESIYGFGDLQVKRLIAELKTNPI